MKKNDFLQDERFCWLKHSLNNSFQAPKILDWHGLYQFADQQAILGVCMPEGECGQHPEMSLFLEWLGKVEIIKERNEVLSKQTSVLTEKLKKDGFRCCVMKGQGNATMYPDSQLRTPGDIDVWVDTEKETLLNYVAELFPKEKEGFKHIKFPFFSDTEVDLHYTPLRYFNPVYDKKLQQWLRQCREIQMSNYVRLPNTDFDIAIPTPLFNAIYQLGHIMIHLEDGGIGLRQMVDYYYVLRQLGGIQKSEWAEIVDAWECLGMKSLAGAVMWVEHYLLGLPKEYLLVEPDEKKGLLLANDILEGGNFGHYRNQMIFRPDKHISRKCADACHLASLSTFFPGEFLFRMVRKSKNIGKVMLGKKWRLGL